MVRVVRRPAGNCVAYDCIIKPPLKEEMVFLVKDVMTVDSHNLGANK